MPRSTRAAKTPEVAAPEVAASAAEWVNPASLTPWAKNPRVNDSAVEPVARSIARFGFAAPVLARAESRGVIAGHTRLLAYAFACRNVWIQEAGTWRERVKADGPFVPRGAPGPAVVPVRFLELPDTEAQALALADNGLGELAEWDDDKLGEVLRDLAAEAVDLSGLGFDDAALERLAGLGLPPEPKAGSTGTTGPQLTGLRYRVVVDVGNETEQAELIERLEAEGLQCEPVIA